MDNILYYNHPNMSRMVAMVCSDFINYLESCIQIAVNYFIYLFRNIFILLEDTENILGISGNITLLYANYILLNIPHTKVYPMSIMVKIAPGSNTADVADKGIAGIPARYIARYASKNPSSKHFELTIANEVYDVTVETPVVVVKAEVKAAVKTSAPVKKPIEKKVPAKRIRPSRSKAAVAARASKK
jgi:hypothetical protein